MVAAPNEYSAFAPSWAMLPGRAKGGNDEIRQELPAVAQKLIGGKRRVTFAAAGQRLLLPTVRCAHPRWRRAGNPSVSRAATANRFFGPRGSAGTAGSATWARVLVTVRLANVLCLVSWRRAR